MKKLPSKIKYFTGIKKNYSPDYPKHKNPCWKFGPSSSSLLPASLTNKEPADKYNSIGVLTGD